MPAKKKARKAAADRVREATEGQDALFEAIGLDIRQFVEPIRDLVRRFGGSDKDAVAAQCVDVLYAVCLTVIMDDEAARNGLHKIASPITEEWEQTFAGPTPIPQEPKLRKERLAHLVRRMVEAASVRPIKYPRSAARTFDLARRWTDMIRSRISGYLSERQSLPEQTLIVFDALQRTKIKNIGKLAAVAAGALLGITVRFSNREDVAKSRRKKARESPTDLQRRVKQTVSLLRKRLTPLIGRGATDIEIAHESATFILKRLPDYVPRTSPEETERAVLGAQKKAKRSPGAQAGAAVRAALNAA